jgi:hypothetical protein
VDLAPGHLLPGAVEGREDRVRPAVLRADAPDVGDEQARLPPHRDPGAVERGLDPPVARERERRDVGGEVGGARANLGGQRRQLLLRPPFAHHEVGAALPQRGAQLGQAAVQEPGAVAGGEASLEQPRVEHEHRHDALARAVGGGQAGVVVDAQVAAEPDEGGARHVLGTGERPGRT